jgi:hypothetical protein
MLEKALDEQLKKLILAPAWRPRGAAVAPAPTQLLTKEMLEQALDDLEKRFLLQPADQGAGCGCSQSPGDERDV